MSIRKLSRLWGDGDHGVVLLTWSESVFVSVWSYLAALFSGNRLIIIAGFTDMHKNYEGFLITEGISNPFKRTRLFKSHGAKM